MIKRKWPGRSAVVLFGYLLICVLPLLAGFAYSFAYSLGLAGWLSEGLTLHHWQLLLRDTDAWQSIGYSVLVAMVSMGLSLSLALLVAWQYERYPWQPMRTWLLLPLAFPPLVAGFAWYYWLSPSGFLSRGTYRLGWIEEMGEFPVLVNDAFGIGMVWTHVFLVFPLFALLFIHQSGKERIQDLWQVARSLGSRPRQFLFSVFIPLQLRKAALLIRLYGVFLMGTYEVAILMGRSSPRVMTLFITDKLGRFNLGDIPQGHAMLVVYMVLAGIFAFGGIKKYTSQL